MFSYRASFIEPVQLSKPIPPVRIMMPNGESVVSTDPNLNEQLSASFGRRVTLSTPSTHAVEFEGYVPEGVEGCGLGIGLSFKNIFTVHAEKKDFE